MHIAFFLPDLNGGGAERVMLTLAKYFASQGHQVDMVLARAEGPLLPLLAPTVRLVDLKCGMRNWGILGLAVTATLQLVRYLRHDKPTTLLSTLTGSNLVAVIAALLTSNSTRCVLREACSLKNVSSLTRRWLIKFFYPKADKVVALTKEIREELVSLGIALDRVVVIGNPVDAEYLRAMALEPCSHPWIINHTTPIVVTVGRLSKQKDHITLILAFSSLLKKMPVRLIVVGEGSERLAIEKLIVDLDLQEYVYLVGFDANPWRWVARSDLFVLSSRWEGYPNVLLEAKVLDVPIVSTEYDASVYELVGENDVVPVGDIDALFSAMLFKLEQAVLFKHVYSNDLCHQREIFSSYLSILASTSD